LVEEHPEEKGEAIAGEESVRFVGLGEREGVGSLHRANLVVWHPAVRRGGG
jgi:hypothetical protein